MKILGLLNSYSQGISGGDKLFIDRAKVLSKTHQLEILTSKLGQNLCQDNDIKATYHITTKEKDFSSPAWIYFKRIFLSIGMLINQRYDLVHSSSDFLPDVLPAYFQKLLSKKTVWEQYIYHLIPQERWISNLAQKISFHFIKSKADKVIVDNINLANDLVRLYSFKKQNIIFQKPQIDLITIKNSPPSEEKYSAIFLGQLRKSKGIFDLIDIWRYVTDTMPQAKLAIIGKDIDNNLHNLKKAINFQQLNPNIDILGFLPSKKTFGLIKSSGLLLLPSHEEGYGMVVEEALACKSKVVTYDLPVLVRNFGKRIYTSPIHNKNEFAKKVISILKDEK